MTDVEDGDDAEMMWKLTYFFDRNNINEINGLGKFNITHCYLYRLMSTL